MTLTIVTLTLTPYRGKMSKLMVGPTDLPAVDVAQLQDDLKQVQGVRLRRWLRLRLRLRGLGLGLG